MTEPESEADDETPAEPAEETEPMEEVDHESPTDGQNRTFERGAEGRDEPA